MLVLRTELVSPNDEVVEAATKDGHKDDTVGNTLESGSGFFLLFGGLGELFFRGAVTV